MWFFYQAVKSDFFFPVTMSNWLNVFSVFVIYTVPNCSMNRLDSQK